MSERTAKVNELSITLAQREAIEETYKALGSRQRKGFNDRRALEIFEQEGDKRKTEIAEILIEFNEKADPSVEYGEGVSAFLEFCMKTRLLEEGKNEKNIEVLRQIGASSAIIEDQEREPQL